MSKAHKLGTAAPKSGPYRSNSTKTEVTGVRGKPLPPAPRASQSYSLVDPTKHELQQ